MNKQIQYTIILVFVSVVAAFFLALVYQITLTPIANYKKNLLLESQKAVLSGPEKFETQKMSGKLQEKFLVFYPGRADEAEYFVGYQGNRKAGVIFKVLPRGYAGPIKMLVGLDPQGMVSGVKIMEQKETPGLGIHILDENFKNSGKSFVSQFIGKSSADKIIPKVDIQAITGATISTRAVAGGIRQALELFKIYNTRER